MKIVYWLNVDWFRRTKKSTIDCRCSKLIDWLIFKTKKSTIDCHSRKLTIRQVKIECNHRFQKENLFIHADSRSFSLIYVVSWRFVLLFHSRRFVLWLRDFSQKNFRFVDLKMLYVNFIQLTKIRFVVSWFFFKKTFWRFYLITRVFRRAIFAEFDRMSISLAELKTRNRVEGVKMISSSSLLIEKLRWRRHRRKLKFRVEEFSSRIDWSCFFLFADRW